MKPGTLRPFLWVFVLWTLFAMGLSVFFSVQNPAFLSAGWTLLISFVCLMDLAAISQLMREFLNWSATSKAELKAVRWIPILFWGALKLGCLTLLIVILYTGRSIPIASVLSGLATLMVVPLAGGMWWWSIHHANEGVTK